MLMYADLVWCTLMQAYVDCVINMRVMYQRCKLVHGDLSEYNMLYFKGTLYIIDVSQSVTCPTCPTSPALPALPQALIH
jgi:serine/threonine-protein kinase RIO1